MTDPSQVRKKRKITYTATFDGVQRADSALKRLGCESKINFAESRLLARSTVTKFFQCQPLQLDSFKKICEALKLNWKEIAGISEEEQLGRLAINDCSSPNTNEGVDSVQTPRRQVTVIDELNKTIIVAIVLEGDINSVSNLKIIASILREYSGETIKIIDIKTGSIKLIVEGSPEDIKRLVSRIKSGELKEVSGFPVEDIQILSESSGDGESNELNDKWRLVQEIVSQPVEGRNLSGADLSDADLRHTNLSNADLSNADLSNADLSNADLSNADLSNADLSNADLRGANLGGANLREATNIKGAQISSGSGLANSEKKVLESRGAILDDSSDDSENKHNTVQKSKNKIQTLRNKSISVKLIFANLVRGKLLGVFRILKNLGRADLSGANLIDAYLSGAILSGADLSRADLSRADLSRANLSDADLSNANLSRADLSGADLSGAILSRATLNGAILSRATLSRAILIDAYLSRADLSGAILSGAILSGATLIGADLSGAILNGANLSRANLSRANLSAADVKGALLGIGLGLTDSEKKILESRGAIFDEGERRPANSLVNR